MRKSQLKRLKRDAEEAWGALLDAREQPERIKRRFAALPDEIKQYEEWIAEIVTEEEQWSAKLTKPLSQYAKYRGTYSHDAAQHIHDLRSALDRHRRYLENKQIEYEVGIEPQLSEAETKIKDAQHAFDECERQLCQYAVFYARQRKDVDLVWTSENEGNWTLDGTVAGTFNDEARKITMKKLILYLIEPHRQRETRKSGDGERVLKAHRNGGNTYVIRPSDWYKAMTGLPTNAYVDVEGCTLHVRKLRTYLRLVDEALNVTVDEESAEITTELPRTVPEREGIKWHRALWKSQYRRVPEAQISIAA